MRNNENTEFGNELHIYYGVHELKKNNPKIDCNNYNKLVFICS